MLPEEPIDAVIQVAMPEEIAPFLIEEEGAIASIRPLNHRTVHIHGKRVLLVVSGVGQVNAAMFTGSILQRYHNEVPLYISAGTAGGIGGEVEVGDVVIASSTANADVDLRAFGYEIGQSPNLPATFPSDLSVLKDTPLSGNINGNDFAIHSGLIVSSDVFTDEARSIQVKKDFPHVVAVDMESVAIAHACFLHNIPFLAVRGISDLCGAADADKHVDDASTRAKIVVEDILRLLS